MTPEQRKMERRARRAERKKRSDAPPASLRTEMDQQQKARIAISDTMLARARTKVRGDWAAAEDIFRPAVPPKGVVPAGEALLAQDADIGSMTAWASSWFGSAVAEGVTFLGYPYLSELATRAEYRVISETLATEMTREWIELKATADEDKMGDKIKVLGDFLDDLGTREAFCKGALLDGLFGRSHLYLDTGDSDDRDELKLTIGNGRDIISQSKVSPDKPLRAIRAIEPVWTYPTRYNSNDPLKGNWYRPDSWFVMGKQIHRSRLLTIVGREVPDLLKPAYSFGGLSLSQMAKPYVENWLRTRQSVADLVQSFTVWVLSTNLSTTSQNDGKQLFDRLDLFNMLRSNQGVMALDKDSEEFKNVTTSLGTLDALQAQTQEHMAAVSRIPLVKLTGISPAGLNASSEGEIRVFYDTIHSMQHANFLAPLRTVVDLAQLSLWGEIDSRISFEFRPLWSLDEKGRAEVRKIQADTAAVYIESGVIATDEERERVAKDPESDYPGLDLNREVLPPDAEGGEEGDDILGGLGKIIDDHEAGGEAHEEEGGAEKIEAPKVSVKEAA